MTEIVSAEPRACDPIRRLRPWSPPLPGWWLPALCLLLGAVCGASYGLLKTSQYTATAYVVVAPNENADAMTALGLAQAYGRVATSTAVLRDARKAAGVPTATLRSSVQPTTSPDAPMIEISATATRAERAAVTANAVARSLVKSGNDAQGTTRVRLALFSGALAPTAPSSPSVHLSTAVGACAGLLVGALLQLVRPRGGRREVPAVPAPAQEPEDSSGTRAPADGKALMESLESTEPLERLDSLESTEPLERLESTEPLESTESTEPREPTREMEGAR
jgi:capsular polysaccharide biosynthesis protein